jgi:cbb3-type cytochrome oxidase subunit 3
VEVRGSDIQQVLIITGIAVAGIFFIGIIYWAVTSRTR